jgi:glycosyltransferase involved in cell wall biosynthesis
LVDPRKASVIVTTYNWPHALERVLWGFAAQRSGGFELVVADDGSAAETRQLVERFGAESGLRLRHVWHPDRGFRKTEILNRAILAAAGEYLLFTDGDCIPRDDFVGTHLRLARPGRFLSGGYLKLPAEVSAAIGVDEVRSGRFADPAWLRSQGWRPGRRALRLTRSAALAAALDALTPTRPTRNGHNASGWRGDLVAANGYDLDMPYGGLDRALGECLENAGVRGLQLRHRAPVLHLHHARPWVDQAAWQRNREHRQRIVQQRRTRAERGLAELEPDPTLRITENE